MKRRTDRRTFLKRSAAAGAGVMILSSGILRGQSPNNKLNIAVIGYGNRGRGDANGVRSENIVAVCDVNDKNIAKALDKFPKAKPYTDWRKCLDQKDIDAVICATTDHTHAFVNVWAMNRGKHVYC
ncbi:MAG: Gfo/Idh/MocA family oxidoreductase, partial [Planctomycetes bacterium]|nr:Gfo/Idh/MocA family oxidoreductase [Planctomycetota bacterium]